MFRPTVFFKMLKSILRFLQLRASTYFPAKLSSNARYNKAIGQGVTEVVFKRARTAFFKMLKSILRFLQLRASTYFPAKLSSNARYNKAIGQGVTEVVFKRARQAALTYFPVVFKGASLSSNARYKLVGLCFVC